MARTVAALALLMLAATLPPAPATAGRPAGAPAESARVVGGASGAADELVRLTNQHRLSLGCPTVRTSRRLTEAAVRHSRDMAAHRRFAHFGSDGSSSRSRAAQAGYPEPVSENIAWGYRSPARVMQAWLHSAPHRANIADCRSRAVGVGVAVSAGGTPFYTQVFGWV